MISLAEGVLAGNRRALARLLTYVENEREGVDAALAHLFSHGGQAHVIGVTGAPGTGKSTLVAAMAAAYRAQGQTVAILAVDPTSPFTGGAVLGDRVRMGALAGDAGVFIRSMATRGNLGGLAVAAKDAIRVLDAAKFNVILVETVGAGQSEVEIVRAAQTTLVVEAPGLGDGVQSIKAGILEIADVLVVNKADRPGATNTVRSLRTMLELGHPTKRSFAGHHGHLLPANAAPTDDPISELWVPPIVQTISTEQNGIEELLEKIQAHRQYMTQSGIQTEQANLRDELYTRLREALLKMFLVEYPPEAIDQLLSKLQARHISPQQAVEEAIAVWSKRNEDANHVQSTRDTLHSGKRRGSEQTKQHH